MKSSEHYSEQLALYIDGMWVQGEGRDMQDVVNPATEDVLATLPLATTNDLDRALAAAQKGFVVWRSISPWKREAIMKRASYLLGERKLQLATILTLENGKPLAEATVEIERAIETIEWCAEEGKRTYGRLLPPRSQGLRETTFKRPIGPVAAFAPWNFPVVLVARKVAAALAAGCSIIVKPAEETPGACVGLIRAFHDAGVPAGVINLVFGVPSHVSEHLITSPVVRKVSFTGSVPVGKRLHKLASDGLKPVTMELGGHSPVVVFGDVDAEMVATQCAVFKFRNAGQVCLSPNRFFVHEAIYKAFAQRFAEVARNLAVGDGMDPRTKMGPLNNVRRLHAAEAFVADAHKHGAKLLTGGSRRGGKGYFFEPTVLSDVEGGASIMQEEPFCPVAPIVAFSTFDEAVEMANNVEYGLAAYAFTDSLHKSSAIAEAFEAGWIGINSFTPALADAPMGGVKQSGVGYEGGAEGIDAYMQTKFLSQASVV